MTSPGQIRIRGGDERRPPLDAINPFSSDKGLFRTDSGANDRITYRPGYKEPLNLNFQEGTDQYGKFMVMPDGKKYYLDNTSPGAPVVRGQDGSYQFTAGISNPYDQFSDMYKGAWDTFAANNSMANREADFVSRYTGQTPVQGPGLGNHGPADTLMGATVRNVGSGLANVGSALSGLSGVTKGLQRHASQAGSAVEALGGGLDFSALLNGAGGMGGSSAPVAPEVPQFQFQNNDFTAEGLAAAANAYAPQYQILNNNDASARAEQQRASQITSGLYANLDADAAARIAQTEQSYANAGVERAQQGTDQIAQIGNIYQNANNEQAALLASLGIQDAYKGAAADMAWQQGQATQNTAAQQDYMQNSGQNQADFSQNMRSADATQGQVAQENLLSQLNSVLQGNANQRLSVASSEAQAAQDMAQRMRSQDIDFQQMQYNALQDAYRNQLSGMQFNQSTGDSNFSRAMEIARMQQSMDNNTWQRQQAQAEFDRSGQQWNDQFAYNAEQDSLAFLLQMLGQGAQSPDPSGEAAIIASAQGQYGASPEEAAQIVATLRDTYAGGAGDGLIMGVDGRPAASKWQDPTQYLAQVGADADRLGLNRATAQALASEYLKLWK